MKLLSVTEFHRRKNLSNKHGQRQETEEKGGRKLKSDGETIKGHFCDLICTVVSLQAASPPVSQLPTTSMQALSVTVHVTGVSFALALLSFVLHFTHQLCFVL